MLQSIEFTMEHFNIGVAFFVHWLFKIRLKPRNFWLTEISDLVYILK